MLNINYKLKTRQVKDQSANRRIRTQTNENTKKISFFLDKPPRQPLQQNKKIQNQSETVHPLGIYSQIKRQKPIKSICTKNVPTKKMTTEPYQRHHIISLGQKAAMDKIFKNGTINGRSSDLGAKKLIIKQKQKKQVQKLQGIARYAFEDKVGAGTFGIVHKARDKMTLQLVAIKKVYQDKKYKNRQLEILEMLDHPNVLKMRDCFYTYQNDKQYLNVVMDYFSSNLYESIQKYRSKTQIPRLKVKVFAYQLFRSLLYFNKISIAHRDIKPQNILVNDSNWNLIMCDFGSAKQLKVGEANISYICSRCYRAPQLIFGNTAYTTQIDMWSAGCVIAEMITMEPMFRAESNIDQLVQIIKIIGTPSYPEMLEMNPECDFQKYQLPKISGKSWQKVIKRKNLGEQFFDLIKKVLIYSPIKRLTPYQALIHPFFDELRQQEVYIKLKNQYNIPNLFDYHLTRQIDDYKIRNLIPRWYKF